MRALMSPLNSGPTFAQVISTCRVLNLTKSINMWSDMIWGRSSKAFLRQRAVISDASPLVMASSRLGKTGRVLRSKLKLSLLSLFHPSIVSLVPWFNPLLWAPGAYVQETRCRNTVQTPHKKSPNPAWTYDFSMISDTSLCDLYLSESHFKAPGFDPYLLHKSTPIKFTRHMSSSFRRQMISDRMFTYLYKSLIYTVRFEKKKQMFSAFFFSRHCIFLL